MHGWVCALSAARLGSCGPRKRGQSSAEPIINPSFMAAVTSEGGGENKGLSNGEESDDKWKKIDSPNLWFGLRFSRSLPWLLRLSAVGDRANYMRLSYYPGMKKIALTWSRCCDMKPRERLNLGKG